LIVKKCKIDERSTAPCTSGMFLPLQLIIVPPVVFGIYRLLKYLKINYFYELTQNNILLLILDKNSASIPGYFFFSDKKV